MQAILSVVCFRWELCSISACLHPKCRWSLHRQVLAVELLMEQNVGYLSCHDGQRHMIWSKGQAKNECGRVMNDDHTAYTTYSGRVY
jgi:nicotinamide riboside kinase